MDRTDLRVAVKIGIQRPADAAPHGDKEVVFYCKINSAAARSTLPGRNSVRGLLDAFLLPGERDCKHVCLVHAPLWWDVEMVSSMRKPGAWPVDFVRAVIRSVLEALEFLHNECQVVHTGRSSAS